MRETHLPSFIVIGAAKAATTWIAHHLQTHPGIFMPGPEPHYFSTGYEHGASWYASWFTKAQTGDTVGEKSADYLASCEAPARIAADLPGVRLIAQLRNPVERAYSDYCMLFRRGTVSNDIEAHLGTGADPGYRFLRDGLYAEHLTRYFDHHPRDAVLIFLQEDIKSDPVQVLTKALTHIGLTPQIDTLSVAKRIKDREAPTLPLPVRQVLKPFKDLVAPLRGHGWFDTLHRSVARPVAYPALTEDLRRRLVEFYRPDIEALEDLIGRDLSAWMDLPSVARAAAVGGR